VMAGTFDQALAILEATFGTSDPLLWTPPRPTTNFNHPIIGNVGSMLSSNRATYAQIVVLSRPRSTAENITPLGQSGFISLSPAPPWNPVLDPHFLDQLDLFRDFEYKPMPLYRNPQLEE